jgi:hypothetical protein
MVLATNSQVSAWMTPFPRTKTVLRFAIMGCMQSSLVALHSPTIDVETSTVGFIEYCRLPAISHISQLRPIICLFLILVLIKG